MPGGISKTVFALRFSTMSGLALLPHRIELSLATEFAKAEARL